MPSLAALVPPLCLLPLLVALLACSSIASTQLPKPLQDLRAADGHYLARDDGEPSAADQRVNVWMLLSRIADGSTLRTGPHRKEITQLVRWLDARRDAEGRVGLRADPDWRLEQAMATYAFWELLFDQPSAASHDRAIATLDALVHELELARPAPDLELLLWCRFLQLAGRALAQAPDTPAPRPSELLALARRIQRDEGLERLTAAMAKLGKPEAPAADASVRQRAAFVLWQALAPEPQLLQAPPPWPDDPLADPWAAFYATAAAFVTGGQPLRAYEQRIDADLVAKVVSRGERAGELPPRGAFGDAHGRVGTTATATLTIAVRHHYVRLHLFE